MKSKATKSGATKSPDKNLNNSGELFGNEEAED